MKGVVLLGDRTLEIREFADPTPGPGEVVLDIKASGMCGSDLKYYRARGGAAALGFKTQAGPVIAGHEPSGVVAAIGPGVSPREARIGQRVMQHHYRGCGVCAHCQTGWMQLCVEGVAEVYGATGHGAHAQYMKCPARTLVPLPDELSFDAGAAISCGTGTAWGALRRLGLSGDQTVAIFGQGPVGLSATLLAAKMGARVIALDTGEERLARATQFGADILINPRTDNVVERIRELTRRFASIVKSTRARIAEVRKQIGAMVVNLPNFAHAVKFEFPPDRAADMSTVSPSCVVRVLASAPASRSV